MRSNRSHLLKVNVIWQQLLSADSSTAPGLAMCRQKSNMWKGGMRAGAEFEKRSKDSCCDRLLHACSMYIGIRIRTQMLLQLTDYVESSRHKSRSGDITQ